MTTTKTTTRKTAAKSAPVKAEATTETAAPKKTGGIAGLAAQAKARRAQAAAQKEAQGAPATGMITESNKAQSERKVPDFWINVGYSVPDENGEEVFVSLPVGISLDNQPERKLNSTDPRINQINAARNHLLNVLREDAEAMESGTSQIIEFLQVQLLRRTEEGKGVLDANHNPFILEELKYEEDAE